MDTSRIVWNQINSPLTFILAISDLYWGKSLYIASIILVKSLMYYFTMSSYILAMLDLPPKSSNDPAPLCGFKSSGGIEYFNFDLSFLFWHLLYKLSIAINNTAISNILPIFLLVFSSLSLFSLFFLSSIFSNYFCKRAISLLRVMISVFISFW